MESNCMKNCRKCGVELVVGENWYPSCAKRGDYQCTVCHKATGRRWVEENREKRREYDAQYYQEHHDEFNDRACQWVQDHPERTRELARERIARWRAVDPIRAQASNSKHKHRRRDREGALPATLTTKQWQEILEEYDYKCAYCGCGGVELHQEHKTPVSRGGGYTKGNIVPACPTCNYRKHTKTYEEFLALLNGN